MRLSRLSAALGVAALVVASLLVAGCAVAGAGGTGSGSSVVTVQGSFASADLNADIVSRSVARSILPRYEIRVYTMAVASISANDYESISIQSDGSFRFEVPRGDTFAAILVDKQAQFRKAVGVIGIGTADGQYWEQIATSELDGNIVLGKLELTGSAGAVLPSQYDLSQIGATVKDMTAVVRLAHMDDTVRFLMNAINAGPETRVDINFVFGQTDDGLNNIIGHFPLPPYYEFAGYQIPIWVDDGSAALIPPGEIKVGTADTYDSNGTGLQGNIFDEGNPNRHFEFGQGDTASDGLIANTVSGYWKLMVGPDVGTQSVQAELDFNVASPMASSTNIALPVPLLNITCRPESDIIESISIRWKIWNGLRYEEITPQEMCAVYDPNLYYFSISDYRVTGSTLREGRSFDPCAGVFIPSQQWHTDLNTAQQTSGAQWAQAISLNYGAGGLNTRFNDRQPYEAPSSP